MKIEKIKIKEIRYKDNNGQPTCAIDFQKNIICKYYRTQKFGCVETCVFAPDSGYYGLSECLERRNNDKGTLIPGKWCPLFEDGVVVYDEKN